MRVDLRKTREELNADAELEHNRRYQDTPDYRALRHSTPAARDQWIDARRGNLSTPQQRQALVDLVKLLLPLAMRGK